LFLVQNSQTLQILLKKVGTVKGWNNLDLYTGVLLMFSAGEQLSWFSQAGKRFELTFFIRKTFLYMYMVTTGGQNHPLSQTICPVPGP